MIHVQTDAKNSEVRFVRLRSHFYEHPGDLAITNINVVRLSDHRREIELIRKRSRDYACGPGCQARRLFDVDLWPKQNRKPEAFAGGGFPFVAALAASGSLMFGKNAKAFGPIAGSHLPNDVIGRFSLLQNRDLAPDDQAAAQFLGAQSITRRHG